MIPCSSEGDYSKARNVFKNLPYKTIDWPEQLWLEWINFENLYGSLDDIEECTEKISDYAAKLRTKREEVSHDTFLSDLSLRFVTYHVYQ